MIIVQSIIAVGISAFVALIGFFQYRTAKLKFALDLFDRRHSVYQAVRTAVRNVSSRGSLDQKEEFELVDTIESAYFFYGDDVISYLKSFQQNVIDVNIFTSEMSAITDPTEKADVVKKVRMSKECIFRFYSEGQPLFALYAVRGTSSAKAH